MFLLTYSVNHLSMSFVLFIVRWVKRDSYLPVGSQNLKATTKVRKPRNSSLEWLCGQMEFKLALRQCWPVVIPFSTACRQPLCCQQGCLVILLAGLEKGPFAIACRFIRSFFTFHPPIGRYWVLVSNSIDWLLGAHGCLLLYARIVAWLHQPVRRRLPSSSFGYAFDLMFSSCYFTSL